MLVETHANMHHEKFSDDLPQVLKRSSEAGVAVLVNICCQIDEFANVIAMAEADENTWATIGVHPHHADKHQDVTVNYLLEKAEHPKVIAIGETGLDYFYDYSPKQIQIDNFLKHIKAAKISNLPMVIHTRDADADMGKILRDEYKRKPFNFVLHSYTSGRKLAQLGAELGGFFSVNGISTFKNAQDVRDVIVDIMPNDKIMLETDCPYLAPVPHRGRRNEPGYLPLIRDQLASLKGWTANEAEHLTTEAFFKLFTKARRPL
jgi:TatD DNase family protein